MIRMKSIAPKGAYWRSIALKLMFRAALRYFSDSERNELDKCDIPVDKCFIVLKRLRWETRTVK